MTSIVHVAPSESMTSNARDLAHIDLLPKSHNKEGPCVKSCLVEV